MNIVAAVAALGTLAGVCAFALMAAGVGNRLQRWAGLRADGPAEQLLFAAGLGVVVFEMGCLVVAACGRMRAGVWLLVAGGGVVALLEFGELKKLFTELFARSRNATRSAKLLRWALLGVLIVEGVAAMAPLTGSDALNYHFAEPEWMLRSGFHPNFFSVPSFLTGQGHLLILAGLALGSEKLALGLLYLGGVLAALAGAWLARRWMPEEGAWTVALVFVLSPVVFWQMSTAGAPDVWMAFFTVLAVLQVGRAAGSQKWQDAVLAGVFAGAIAGSKYTGCVIAASVGLAVVVQTRSWKATAGFMAGALSSGVWPYLRNLIWTGDPIFPFWMQRLHPEKVNAVTLASMLADTGANGHRGVLELLGYPVFAAINSRNVGFWQFFSPICLCFAPLLIFAVRRTALWGTALSVWLIGAVGIGMASGMLRFVLPVYPLALAAVIAGVCAIPERGWGALRGIAAATLAIFLTAGAAGLLFYERHSLAAALGMLSRDTYLEGARPDFGRVRFINEALRGREEEGKALVFFRHIYGLRVQQAYGNPEASWAVDPEKLSDVVAWREFFQREGIRWVVKSPDYPEAIQKQLGEMEVSGELLPIASTEVMDFAGNRMQGVREKVSVVILEVRPATTLR